MMEIVRRVQELKKTKKIIPDFRAGDTVEVFVKVREGEKERLQVFRGVVIKLQGAGQGRTFTVRKVSDGVGVERTFLFASPGVDRVKVISHGQVRRAKLYYLRQLAGKKARIRSEWAQELGLTEDQKAKEITAE